MDTVLLERMRRHRVGARARSAAAALTRQGAAG